MMFRGFEEERLSTRMPATYLCDAGALLSEDLQFRRVQINCGRLLAKNVHENCA